MIIAATGHRPDKLGGYGPHVRMRLHHLAKTYLKSQHDILEGALTVISGMALGWDTAWAIAALDLGISVIAAVPFVGQEKQWQANDKVLYHEILKRAADVVVVSEGGYEIEKMQLRNEWMVDRADRVCALWDGSSGGTGNCIRYVRKFGKPIDHLWDLYNA